MPSRNIIKVDAPTSYYHVYARGINQEPLFLTQEDFTAFLKYLARYLSPEPKKDAQGRSYPHLVPELELLSYCLMGNHFHLLLYQEEAGNMPKLMRGLMTSYSQYFNRVHKRRGPVFESRYKATRIDADNYLSHISRYIHLNPRDWRMYPYSSIHAYSGEQDIEWLNPRRILAQFRNPKAYLDFVAEYQDRRDQLEELKQELADS